VGDLILLYLAQDGSYETFDPALITYGQLTSTTNAGAWQINMVQSVTINAANSIVRFVCDLPAEFTSIGTSSAGGGQNYYRAVMTQFIMADTLTLTAGSAISAPPFKSVTPGAGGGVVAIIANLINMADGSSINADGDGFIGGAEQNGADCTTCNFCNQKDYAYDNIDFGAEKGASIAPFSESLAVRQYGRGALINGGGGGNNHNAPGGGGANVCSSPTGTWTGRGVCVPFPLVLFPLPSASIAVLVVATSLI